MYTAEQQHPQKTQQQQQQPSPKNNNSNNITMDLVKVKGIEGIFHVYDKFLVYKHRVYRYTNLDK
jgi:hypothetical protein